MLGTRLGTGIPLYTPGQRERGVIVPAIPGGEISGRVFDEAGNPVVGCLLTALFPGHVSGALILEQRFDVRTDSRGAYRFANIDADRYYLSAQCDKLSLGETQDVYGVTSTDWRRRKSWLHVLYPDARLINGAKAIIVPPGTKKTGIDFHLHSVEAFSIRGRFVRAKKEKPVQTAVYFTDFLFSSNGTAIPPIFPGYGCRWDAHSTMFRCDFVTPGSYRLQMSLSTGWPPVIKGAFVSDLSDPQTGTMDVQIDSQPPPELKLQLHERREPRGLNHSMSDQRSGASTGELEVVMETSGRDGLLCPTFLYTFPSQVPSEGSQNHYLSCAVPVTQQMTPGAYSVAACSRDFWSLSPKPAILELIAQRGAGVTVKAHKKTVVEIPVFKVHDIYQMVLDYLHRPTLVTN
jgi:hypothetical protein